MDRKNIVLSQAKISDTPFNQKIFQPPEVGGNGADRQTHRHRLWLYDLNGLKADSVRENQSDIFSFSDVWLLFFVK